MIEIEHCEDNEWRIVVKGPVTTHHRVRVTKTEIDLLAQGRPVEELLRESFQFLLEREPNTSILSSFGLLQIGRYFPEYQQEIRLRLSKQK